MAFPRLCHRRLDRRRWFRTTLRGRQEGATASRSLPLKGTVAKVPLEGGIAAGRAVRNALVRAWRGVRGSGCRGSCGGQTPGVGGQHKHAPQVEADCEQGQLKLVAQQSEVTRAAVAVALFEHRKYRLDAATDFGECGVAALLLERESMMFVGPMHDAVLEAE